MFGNVDAVLCGLVATLLTSLVIDKIMYGMSTGTMLVVITDHGHEVAQRIEELIDCGATELQAKGSYMVRRAAYEVDPAAFIVATETSEVFGEGFNNNPFQIKGGQK